MSVSQSTGNFSEKPPQSLWHKSAPKCVQILTAVPRGTKTDSGEAERQEAWQAWAKHLRKRKRPVPLAELLPAARAHPLTWALSGELAQAASGKQQRRPAAVAELDRVDEKMLSGWLDELAAAGPVDPLEALAWCHALPRLAEILEAADWWALLERLVSIAVDASSLLPSEDSLHGQLCGGELPLTLAYLFPEITVCRRLARQARAVLSTGLVDLLDGQGMPHAGKLDELRPLLASWTRCRMMGRQLKRGCFNADAELQFQWLIRQALRLARGDGSAVFSPLADQQPEVCKTRDVANRGGRDLLAAAAACGDRDDREILSSLFSKQQKKAPRATLPEAAYHSEWAAVGVLRPDWSADGPRLAARFGGRASVGVELCCKKNVVFSGPWRWEITLDGKQLQPLGDWESTCWVSDAEADYLELELALSGNVVLQRHMLMAREDGLLLLADSVLCDPCETQPGCSRQNALRLKQETRRKPLIGYRVSLPLVPGVDFRPQSEGNEGLLAVGRKNLARLLPLALPEWRDCESPGALELGDDGLELRFSLRAEALFAPLLFDFDGRRFPQCLTWRQLTVAESLQKQPADVAVGYRVQLGRKQWLIYRSLAPQANRTLLGHNLSTEMLFARFNHSGMVEPLVEIE